MDKSLFVVRGGGILYDGRVGKVYLLQVNPGRDLVVSLRRVGLA